MTRLAVLGVLSHLGKGHGYEICSAITRFNMDRYAGVQRGSVYAALERLESEGKIAQLTSEKPGSMPVRLVYVLTAAVWDELRELLRTAWAVPMRFDAPLELAHNLLLLTPPDEIVALLHQRLEVLAGWEAEIDAAERETGPIGEPRWRRCARICSQGRGGGL